jgi:hypothetical protein
MMMKNQNTQWVDSNAKWITAANSDEQNNLYVQFVKRFELDSAKELSIAITAVSQYMLWVNGRLIGRGPAVGDLRYYYYDVHAISADVLKKGQNVIAVLLYHDGDTVNEWQDNGVVQGFEYGKPGLIAHVTGDGVEFVTDSSWKVKRSEVYSGISRVSRWGGYCESYHGEKEEDWMGAEYDSGQWEPAVERAKAISEDYVQNLTKLELPSLEVQALKPERIVDAANGLAEVSLDIESLPVAYTEQSITVSPGEYGAMPSVTFDFGTMTVGYPEIEVEGAFCVYEVWYGETLDLYRLDAVRKSESGLWKAFQRRAFRYLKINFIALEGDVTVKRVGMQNTWYAYNDAGGAESSDELTNRIMDISKHTLKLNTSYHYEDCPWREQALWIFDMRVMALINYYYYGDSDLVAKNLRQCFAIQNEDGSVNSTGPKKNTCYHLDFCMHLVSTLCEYYRYSGDRELVVELMPYVQRLDRFIRSFEASDGLLNSGPVAGRGAPFLDWSNDIDKLGKSVILNAVYAHYLNDIAMLSRIVGADSGGYETAAGRVGPSVNNLLFNSAEGLYRDTHFEDKLSGNYSLQGNMAALYGGFADEKTVSGIFDKLTDTKRFPSPYAPSFYLLIFETLAKYGKNQQILDHIKRYWGGMLSRQAVTWWEVFNPDSEQWVYPHPYLGNVPTYEMNWIPISSCHGWSGAAGYAIPRYLLGVDLLNLHEDKVIIKPGLDGYFKRFTYKLPLRGQMLWLDFTGDGKAYQIDVKQCPDGIEVVF